MNRDPRDHDQVQLRLIQEARKLCKIKVIDMAELIRREKEILDWQIGEPQPQLKTATP